MKFIESREMRDYLREGGALPKRNGAAMACAKIAAYAPAPIEKIGLSESGSPKSRIQKLLMTADLSQFGRPVSPAHAAPHGAGRTIYRTELIRRHGRN